MSDNSVKETKWQEIKKNLTLLSVVISTLLGLFFLFLSVVGIIAWITTGYVEFLVGSVIFFVFFIPCGYIVKKFEPEWRQFERRRGYTPPTTTDSFKSILKGLAWVVASFLLLLLLNQYFRLFPQSIEPNLAIEIIKAIIQINGILIGFSGLVFAQLLWAIHSQQNVVYQEKLAEGRLQIGEGAIVVREDLYERLKVLEATRRSMIVNIFFTVVPFVVSILISLSKMAWVGSYEGGYPIRMLLWDPLFWLVFGICFFTLVTMRTKLISERE